MTCYLPFREHKEDKLPLYEKEDTTTDTIRLQYHKVNIVVSAYVLEQSVEIPTAIATAQAIAPALCKTQTKRTDQTFYSDL